MVLKIKHSAVLTYAVGDAVSQYKGASTGTFPLAARVFLSGRTGHGASNTTAHATPKAAELHALYQTLSCRGQPTEASLRANPEEVTVGTGLKRSGANDVGDNSKTAGYSRSYFQSTICFLWLPNADRSTLSTASRATGGQQARWIATVHLFSWRFIHYCPIAASCANCTVQMSKVIQHRC